MFFTGFPSLYAQHKTDSGWVDFKVGSSHINRSDISVSPDMSVNRFIHVLDSILKDSTQSLLNVSFYGSTSPEGSSELNRKLAQRRLETLEHIIREHVSLPEHTISRHNKHIAWDELLEQVKASDIPHKEEVIDIIENKEGTEPYGRGLHIDSRVPLLQGVDQGNVWNILYRDFFPLMRKAWITYTSIQSTGHHSPHLMPELSADTTYYILPLAFPQLDYRPSRLMDSIEWATSWKRSIHIKTNVIGWGMGISNAAIEADVCKHWSVTLPVYYSAWNFFKSTLKFRTLAMQPEVRYWFLANEGWFVGAHLGVAWYNLATAHREYRIQDKGGHTPAWGGGVGAGYRLPISHNKRWKLEASVGIGAYHAQYDRFRNKPNGLWIDCHRKTYFGIDNASLSLSYSFKLKNRRNWK